MMLGSGTRGSIRILSRTAVEVMTTDQIAPAQKAVSDFFPGFWDRYGWGLGISVITNRTGLAPSVGSFGWDGGFGTSFWVDPTEGLIGVLLTQRVWDSPVDRRRCSSTSGPRPMPRSAMKAESGATIISDFSCHGNCYEARVTDATTLHLLDMSVVGDPEFHSKT